MLFHLLYERLAQVDGLSFLNVFRYTSTRLLAAAITALLISFLLGPWFIKRLKSRQIGQNIRDDGPESHQKKAGTPTMGGSLILFAMVMATLLWCDLRNQFVWITLAVTVGFGIVGFLDDYASLRRDNTKGIPGKLRLLIEFAIAGSLMTYLYSEQLFGPASLALQLPFTEFATGSIYLPAWLYIAFSTVLIVGAANAVNLTDGLDGLAIGPSIINAGTFLIFAYLAGSTAVVLSATGGQEILADYLHIAHIPDAHELTIFCAAMAGAGMGFLWYNTYPASVFMGDVGALSLGSALGTVAVLTKQEFILCIVGGIFVVETLSVIIQVGSFKLRGKRVFRMAPIHHHYELKGWEEPKIIVRFWLINVLLALIALGTLKMR